MESAGFTLVEPLVVVAIIPLVVGAISVSPLAVFKNQQPVANSLTSSGDAQVKSSACVQDVEGASWITSNTRDLCRCHGSRSTTTRVVSHNALGSTSESAFTSANNDTVPSAIPSSFSVAATGVPAPALSQTGLPAWATFNDNGNGTLAACVPVIGSDTFVHGAQNTAGSVAQTFTLAVSASVAPSFNTAVSDSILFDQSFRVPDLRHGLPEPHGGVRDRGFFVVPSRRTTETQQNLRMRTKLRTQLPLKSQ